MKYWNSLDGSIFFNKVFSTPIAIGAVELFTIIINNNTPDTTLEFDIPEVPDSPPEKWKKMQFNTCRIGINISNIQNLTIKNIPTKGKLHTSIAKEDNLYTVKFYNQDSLIQFSADHILLCGPSVYMNVPEEPPT